MTSSRPSVVGTCTSIICMVANFSKALRAVSRDAVPTFLPAGPLPRGIATTDRKGRFKLAGLPEGKVAIEAYLADFGRGRAEDVPVRAGRVTGAATRW